MKSLDNILDKQKLFYSTKLVSSDISSRITKIKRIKSWILKNKEIIAKTCSLDYYKPLTEIYSTEINPILNHIDFNLKHIKRWVRPKYVSSPWFLISTKSKIHYEPKGCCLIISPWNYPFNLTLNPLISAIAAGNCVIIKPSEHTPSLSSLIDKMISDLFDGDEIKVIQGDENIGSYLISMKFDHIFFTGSPEVGRKVMRSAANNFSSVTLELGGINHSIVDETANLKSSAEKILWSKFLNAGQTCIAVNHTFVHESIYDNFLNHLRDIANNFFSKNNDYASIVNSFHFKRINDLVNLSLKQGSNIFYESVVTKNKLCLPLKIVKLKNTNNCLLDNEIFGPILPVIKYNDINDLIKYINYKDKPLALYLFSKSKSNKLKVTNNTSSGTLVVNDTILQYSNPYLLFGGVNKSGFGKIGRRRGFIEFSNEKSVLSQFSAFTIAKLLYPPYNNIKSKLANLVR